MLSAQCEGQAHLALCLSPAPTQEDPAGPHGALGSTRVGAQQMWSPLPTVDPCPMAQPPAEEGGLGQLGNCLWGRELSCLWPRGSALPLCSGALGVSGA
jgi:hypothetical protein